MLMNVTCIFKGKAVTFDSVTLLDGQVSGSGIFLHEAQPSQGETSWLEILNF